LSADSIAVTLPQPATEVVDSMRKTAQVIFGLYMVIIQVLIVYLLIKIWPDKIPPSHTREPVYFFGHIHSISPEVRFLLIAVFVGALGGYVLPATSLVEHIGNRKTSRRNWLTN